MERQRFSHLECQYLVTKPCRVLLLGRVVLSDEFCGVTRADHAVHALLDCVLTGAERSRTASPLLTMELRF